MERFPGPRDVSGAPPSLRNTEKGVPDGFFLASNMQKIHFQPGKAPDMHGELTALPQIRSRMVRGHPSPRFLPLDAFGVSISGHTECGCDRARPGDNGFPGPAEALDGLATTAGF